MSAADTFTINGNEITVPEPKGFVRITDDMSGVAKVVEQMVDPMNDTLAYYILESDVPAAMAGEIPSLEKTFVLKVNKQLRNVTVGKKDFLEVKSMTKDQNKQMFDEVKAKIPEHMLKISQGISEEFDVDYAMSVSQMVPLEPHYEAENAMAFSMFINYGVSSGGQEEEKIVASTSTFLNASGTILFLYGYAPEEELAWTRTASMDWAESAMRSNSAPPEKSPRRGIDWGKVMEKALLGAILGGGLALFAGLKSLFRRKHG